MLVFHGYLLLCFHIFFKLFFLDHPLLQYVGTGIFSIKDMDGADITELVISGDAKLPECNICLAKPVPGQKMAISDELQAELASGTKKAADLKSAFPEIAAIIVPGPDGELETQRFVDGMDVTKAQGWRTASQYQWYLEISAPFREVAEAKEYLEKNLN